VRRTLVAAALALLTAACGTTVPSASTTSTGDGGLSAPVPSSPIEGSVPAPGTSLGQLPPGQQPGAVVGPTRTGTTTGGPSSRGAAAAAARGVTATTLRIGVAYQANLDAANRALGGESITVGDQVAETNILVKDINARGGLAGRRLVVDFFAYDAQSTQPYAAQDQAACQHFTQDVAVFVVIGAGLTEAFQQCMERAGTAVIGADIVRFSAADFRRYPHFFDVQELDLDRLTRALAAELLEHGWATPWDAALGRPGTGRVRAGVIAFDQPRYATAVRRDLVPALRRGGVSLTDSDVVLVQEPSSQSDIGPAAAQVQSAVLRFRQDGVSHVVLLDTHGGITQVFLNAAEAQRYRPRYGMGSGSGTQALLDGGIIRAEQLAGARGLGWIPMLDLPASGNHDDGRWSSWDRRRCLSLMRAGGQSFTSSNASSVALLYCDQLWLLERALTHPAGLTLASLTAGIEALGSRAPSASLGAASYGPAKHVAVARGVEWSFAAACSCMVYGRSRVIR
jgi:ABC-type branched-subunit amino acid transport system substrate-binding protein